MRAAIPATWLFPEFILFIIGPIGYYMAAAMLFPARDSGESLDVHLLDRRKPFFLVMALTVASLSASGWLVVNDPVSYQDIARLVAIALYGVLAVTRRKSVHWVSALSLLGALLWFTYFFTLRIG